jgi:glycosyltransferase involved in cell wall biosynthesis
MPLISLVVITLDGEKYLRNVLRSAACCDERLVLDSGSRDGTLTIAGEEGARVEHQPFLGYGPQKQRAVELASHDWILSLDDDEVLDEEAAAAVRAADLSDPAVCYELPRRTFVGGREVRHGAWSGERVLRLFNRRTAGFSPLAVHECVLAPSRPRQLAGSILHHSYDDLTAVLARSLRYAPLKARVMADKGQRTSVPEILARGLAAFAKSYLLRRGFLDGSPGFVVAISRVIDATLPRAMLLAGEVSPAEGDSDRP